MVYDVGEGSNWGHAGAVLGTFIGCVAIYGGLTKGPFYALGPGQRPTPKTKSWPRWLGCLWFCALGGYILYWSIPALRGSWRWHDLIDAVWIVTFFAGVWGLNWFVKKLGRTHERQIVSLDQDEKN